jgi:hypothetical protein
MEELRPQRPGCTMRMLYVHLPLHPRRHTNTAHTPPSIGAALPSKPSLEDCRGISALHRMSASHIASHRMSASHVASHLCHGLLWREASQKLFRQVWKAGVGALAVETARTPHESGRHCTVHRLRRQPIEQRSHFLHTHLYHPNTGRLTVAQTDNKSRSPALFVVVESSIVACQTSLFARQVTMCRSLVRGR